MYTLSETFRTKAEAGAAARARRDSDNPLRIVREDGKVLDQANGDPYMITGKLDHYAQWFGKAAVWGGIVESIR
jgi:hypothetical protein